MSDNRSMQELKEDYKPSTSTVVSVALGAPLATVVIWVLNEFAKVTVPAEVGAAFGAIFSAMIGYFFNGGKSSDNS